MDSSDSQIFKRGQKNKTKPSSNDPTPLSRSLAYVYYNSYCLSQEDSNLLSAENFEIFGEFNGGNIFYTISDIIDNIEATDLIDLIQKPSDIVKNFLSFYRTYTSESNFRPLAFNWPPAFNFQSTFSRHTKLLHLLLLRHLMLTSKPQKMLFFFVTCLVPNTIQTRFQDLEMNSTESSDDAENTAKNISQKMYAASLIQEDPPKYAILDESKFLYIFEQFDDPTPGLKCSFHERISRVKFKQETNELLFYNSIAQQIMSLPMNDEKLGERWSNVFNKKERPNFLTFLTKVDDIIPTLIYHGTYQALFDHNMLSVHSLFSPGVVTPSFFSELALSIIDISTYQNRFVFCMNTILSSIFESNISTVEYLCSDDCILKYFSAAIALRTDRIYAKNFGGKLIRYIENEEQELNPFETKNRLTIVFFTTMKYILDSAPLLSDNFKTFCSMVSNYVILKFNSTEAVIRIISSFFCYLFSRFLSDRQKQNPEKSRNLSEIKKLIQNSFNFRPLVPKYQIDGWQERINNHLYPRIAKFALSLCSTSKELQIKSPPIDTAICAIEKVIKIIAANNKAFSKKIEELKKKQETNEFSGKTNATSWCFALNISMHFTKITEMKTNEFQTLYAPAFPILFSLNEKFNEKGNENENEIERFTEAKTKKQLKNASNREKLLFNQKDIHSFVFNKVFDHIDDNDDVLEILSITEEESEYEEDFNEEEEKVELIEDLSDSTTSYSNN